MIEGFYLVATARLPEICGEAQQGPETDVCRAVPVRTSGGLGIWEPSAGTSISCSKVEETLAAHVKLLLQLQVIFKDS